MKGVSLSNAISPQSHGDTTDFEEKVGEHNVSYDTLRVQDSKVDLSKTASHSYNIVSHINFIEGFSATEEYDLGLLSKSGESINESRSEPRSYLDKFIQNIEEIKQDSSDNVAEIKKQHVQIKENKIKEVLVEKIEARATKMRDLETESIEKSIENKALSSEIVRKDIESTAIDRRVIAEIMDDRATDKQILESIATKKIVQEQLYEEEILKDILDTKAIEKKELNVQSQEDKEQKVKEQRSITLEENDSIVQSAQNKNIGIEYSENTQDIDANSASISSNSYDSSFEKSNRENAKASTMQEVNPEVVQSNFGLNFFV